MFAILGIHDTGSQQEHVCLAKGRQVLALRNHAVVRFTIPNAERNPPLGERDPLRRQSMRKR